MKVQDKRYNIILITAFAVALLDQTSKWLIVTVLPEHGVRTVVPGFFDIVHFRNRGAAFGFLNSPHIEWQFWLFLLAALVALWFIWSLARQATYSRLFFIGLGLITGGALGNLIDRVRFRSVIDFLDVSFRGWHWPAFNLADSAICVGAALVCWNLWKHPVPHSKGKACPF